MKKFILCAIFVLFGISTSYAVGSGSVWITGKNVKKISEYYVELKSASTRYTDPGVGQVAYWGDPDTGIFAFATVETLKPSLRGNSLFFNGTDRDFMSIDLPATSAKNITVASRVQLSTNITEAPCFWANGFVIPYMAMFTYGLAQYVEIGNFTSNYLPYTPSNYTATKTWIVVSDAASGTMYEDGVNRGTLVWGTDCKPDSAKWYLGPSKGNGHTLSYFSVYKRKLSTDEILSKSSELAAEYP